MNNYNCLGTNRFWQKQYLDTLECRIPHNLHRHLRVGLLVNAPALRTNFQMVWALEKLLWALFREVGEGTIWWLLRYIGIIVCWHQSRWLSRELLYWADYSQVLKCLWYKYSKPEMMDFWLRDSPPSFTYKTTLKVMNYNFFIFKNNFVFRLIFHQSYFFSLYTPRGEGC